MYWKILGCCAVVTAFSFAWNSPSAHGQVVQLPTFQVFNVNTAVKVPDGGRVRLGGIGRTARGGITRGVPGLSKIPGVNRLFKNRAIGSETGGAHIDVTAEIIILEEYEEAVMAEARRRQNINQAQVEIERKAEFIAKNIGRNNR